MIGVTVANLEWGEAPRFRSQPDLEDEWLRAILSSAGRKLIQMNSDTKRLKTLILAAIFVVVCMSSRCFGKAQGNQVDK
ncbi:hypothetical protein Neosp_011051 [[Neocosmospora] mangrovei]